MTAHLVGNVRPCWACTIKKEIQSRMYRPPRDGARAWTSWELYERAVEAIESFRGKDIRNDKGFRIVDVWLRAGGGPAQHTYARIAVYDMAAHGLVEPVEFRTDGKPSLWRIKEAR